MSKKKKRRKSTSAAIYIPVATLLIIFLATFGTSAFFKIVKIEVGGAEIYGVAEIIRISGIAPGDNMILVDTIDAQRRIYSAMPIISEVIITRAMPDTIRIDVKESTPLAFLKYQGEILILDSAGRVIYRIDNAPGGLIEVRGISPADAAEGNPLKAVSGGETQLNYMTEILSAIEKAEIQTGVSYIDVTNIAGISFGYLGRFTVVLGGPDGARHKLSRLPEAVAEVEASVAFDATGRYKIDMSDPSGKWIWTPER